MRAIRGSEIAMIFQEPMTALNPLYTVGNQIGEVLELHEAPAHIVRLVAEGGALDADEQSAVMGEALPLGLSIA